MGSQDTFQVIQKLGHVKSGRELTNPVTDTLKVKPGLDIKKRLNVRLIPRAVRNGLHNHQIFRPRKRNRDASHVHPLPTVDGLLLEWQHPDGEIRIGVAGTMAEEEDARPDREPKAVMDSRDEAKRFSRGQEFVPGAIAEPNDSVNVSCSPGPP